MANATAPNCTVPKLGLAVAETLDVLLIFLEIPWGTHGTPERK